MTLAQIEERLTSLGQIQERLTVLEQIVERLQMRINDESKPDSSSSDEKREQADDDLIPGTEYDLVVTVPPKESVRFQARIVSIQTPPAELGLTDDEWAFFGSENEDE